MLTVNIGFRQISTQAILLVVRRKKSMSTTIGSQPACQRQFSSRIPIILLGLSLWFTIFSGLLMGITPS